MATSSKKKINPSASNERIATALEQHAEHHPAPEAQAIMREAAARLRATPATTVEYQPALILDGTAHLMRDGKRHAVKGGVLVRDTDLTEAEIEELTALRFIRYATSDELAELLAAGETPDPEEDA